MAVGEARSTKLRATPAVPEADQRALALGNAEFALTLHRKLVESQRGNLVFSPVSISTALAMTYAGALGETEAQMRAALRFTLPQGRLHAAMNHLDQQLATRGEGTRGADGKAFRLRIVNAIWSQKGFTMLPAYLEVLAESYGAGVKLLDFIAAPEAARRTINRWVEDRTEKRIKDLLPAGSVGGRTSLVLTNAVYFNAAWRLPFSKNTTNGPFHRADGSTVSVPMMRKEGRFKAVATADYAAVVLPYEDQRLSMLIVVPETGRLAAVEAALDGAKLVGIDATLTKQRVILGVPRFRFEMPIDLKPALSALGMPVAFSSAADFSGIDGTWRNYIGAVLHKAFIEVAETGTEAAAATAVVMVRVSLPTGLQITADRPFLFFLRDEPTGAVLFLGRVMDPS